MLDLDDLWIVLVLAYIQFLANIIKIQRCWRKHHYITKSVLFGLKNREITGHARLCTPEMLKPSLQRGYLIGCNPDDFPDDFPEE